MIISIKMEILYGINHIDSRMSKIHIDQNVSIITVIIQYQFYEAQLILLKEEK